MTLKPMILLIAAFVLAVVVSGCSSATQNDDEYYHQMNLPGSFEGSQFRPAWSNKTGLTSDAKPLNQHGQAEVALLAAK